MNYQLVFRPEAEDDIALARDWYDLQQPGLGQKFLTTLDETIDRLQAMPELHAIEYKSVRRTGVRQFPYIVYYRIIADIVEVIAIQHGSRHQRTWQSRA